MSRFRSGVLYLPPACPPICMDHPVHHLASSLTPRILFPRTLTLPSQVPRSHSDRKPATQTPSCCVSLFSRLTSNFLTFLLQLPTVPISASPRHFFPRVFQFLAFFFGYPGSPFVKIIKRFFCSHWSLLLDPLGVRAPWRMTEPNCVPCDTAAHQGSCILCGLFFPPSCISLIGLTMN